MLKKILAIILVILTLFISSACTYFENTTSVSSDTESEVVESESLSSESESESEVFTSELTEDTSDTVESKLISDEEAIELFNNGHFTVNTWLKCNVLYGFVDETKDIIYRDFGDYESVAFYPLSKNAYARIGNYDRDIAGNIYIRYGNHDWMQENLQKIFTERFIEKYFAYEYPYPFIYENQTVYFQYPDTPGFSPNDTQNYTVIHKTENEVAVMCEVYDYDWSTWSLDYSEIASLSYMKFVKSGDTWLIDECYGYGDYFFVHPKDRIPSEYMDKVPEKYHEMTMYFEGGAEEENSETKEQTNSEIYQGEPPLSKTELTMAVPDFLDLEQQILYRQAYSVYRHLFGGSPEQAGYPGAIDHYSPSQNITFENEKGWRYIVSNGRYQNWDDFMGLVLSVFTEDFFDSKNSSPAFVEHNGKLAYIDAAKGGSMAYNINFEDEFELVSKTDSEIVFNVIGHYSYMYPKEGETSEERDARVKSGWQTTEKFTIRMVMTKSGWRFDEFYSAALDHKTSVVELY